MKLSNSLCLAWLLVGPAAALDVGELQNLLPECALECVKDGVAKNNCSLLDFECACSKVEPIIKTVSPCLAEAGCDVQNITATSRAVQDACKTLPGVSDKKTGGTPSTAGSAASYRVGWGAMVMGAAVNVLF